MLVKNIKRKSSGSMLIFAMLGFVLLAVLIFAGLSFGSLFFIHSQAQRFADDIALAGACQLNDANRLGQMNCLVARCRQLVYASWETTQFTTDSNQSLQMLSQQLLNEAHENACTLQAERLRLQQLSVNEAQSVMNKLFEEQASHYCLSLPWLKTEAPDLVSIQFGSVADVDSNVPIMSGMTELVKYDQARSLLDNASGLYQGNINASMPWLDNSLHFLLASLAAPVNGMISPARLIEDDAFQLAGNNQLSSAIKVILEMKVGSNGHVAADNMLTVGSDAAAGGGVPSVK